MLPILRAQRLWPLWIALGVSLLLLPSLGSYGFMEPNEITTVVRTTQQDSIPSQTTVRATKSSTPASTPNSHDEPPLRNWLVRLSTDAFGVSEFTARIPFFFLALVTALATYFLGVRIHGPTAGLAAVVVLVACPLFIFQARQLESELATMAGSVLTLYGAISLCSRSQSIQSYWRQIFYAALLLGGCAVTYKSSGLFVGVLPPLGAIALAITLTAWTDTAASTKHVTNITTDAMPCSSPEQQKFFLRVASAIAMSAFIGASVCLLVSVFDWIPANDGELSLFGKTVQTAPGYQTFLAGQWKSEGNLQINFNSLFEHIAFGMFPWISLAPIAIVRINCDHNPKSSPLGTRMILAWAAICWLISTIAIRNIGPTQYAAVPAIALAIGIWMANLLNLRKNVTGDVANNSVDLVPPLIALFVGLAGVTIAKDIRSFPELFLALHLDKSNIKFPEDTSLHNAVMVLGIAFTVMLSVGIYGWSPKPNKKCWQKMPPHPCSSSLSTIREKLEWFYRRGCAFLFCCCENAAIAGQNTLNFLGRKGIIGAFFLSLVMSIFLAHVWIPRLSTTLSSKSTFETYQSLQSPNSKLGILGRVSEGIRFYASDELKILRSHTELIKFLQSPERVFSLFPERDLCAIHKNARANNVRYYIVDRSHPEKLMLSNRLSNHAADLPPEIHRLMQHHFDQNPLVREIVRTLPPNIPRLVKSNFGDQIELLGVDLPSEVTRGTPFDVTLFYKVLKPMPKSWQIFVHFDGSRSRFQADHWPINKHCATNHWQPGDYIIDKFTAYADNTRGVYTMWTGLFRGKSPNWERLEVRTAETNKDDRVSVGTVRVQ